MPGSKPPPKQHATDDVLDEPWTNPQGTENETKRMHRALLPEGYPADLSRDSQPEQGGIGFASMPKRDPEAPFRNLKGGR